MNRPAWSRESRWLRLPIADKKDFSPDWAFAGSTGRGVRVAVVDSGIDADHPQLQGAIDVEGGVEFTVDRSGVVHERHGAHADVYGHGTACAGLIHVLAPEASITSVRVIDDSLRGKASAFHAGLTWAVEQEFDIINLSLGAAKRDWALAFHDTCDRGYFANSFIVTAANNINRDSFPSLFASVASVASNTSDDPLRFHFNPEPPTEFLARGIDVEVPWLNGSTIVTTGNSFAAPHIAGFAALIKSKHPELRPFQIKTALWAASANVREATRLDRAGRSTPVALGPGRTTFRATNQPGSRQPSAQMPTGPAAAPDRPSPAIARPSPEAEIQALMTDYEVGSLVAFGPWGPVFSASKDGTPVALRRLDASLAFDAPTRDRFAASVRIASSLRHPHILPILELREEEYFAVIVMPLCPSNLAAFRGTGPMELGPAMAAVISLLHGLHVAHAAGIYHGDLRPENALIDDQGRVLLSDVGIAAALSSDARTTSAPHDPLSWRYLAPEQLDGGAIAAYTDIYAVGLLLFELLSEELPWPDTANLGELVRQRAGGRPRRLAELRPDLDSAIGELADHAVAVDPAERPSSAVDLAAALEEAVTELLGAGWLERQPFRVEIPSSEL